MNKIKNIFKKVKITKVIYENKNNFETGTITPRQLSFVQKAFLYNIVLH